MKIGKFGLARMPGSLIARPIAAAVTLIDMSYDPTREPYRQINGAFATRRIVAEGKY